MKIINDNKKSTIILEEDDILEVSTFYKNKESIVIKCINSTLHIDELDVDKVKEKSIEEKEIDKMKKYLNEKE